MRVEGSLNITILVPLVIFAIFIFRLVKAAIKQSTEAGKSTEVESRVMPDQLSQKAKTEKLTYAGTGPFTVRGNTLIRPWKENFSGSLLPFGIVWFASSFPFLEPVRKELLTGNFKSSFVLIFPTTSFFIFYYLVCQLINKTTYSVNGDHLSAKKGPLPSFSRDIHLKTSDIRQFYIQEFSSESQNNRPVIAYRLMAQVLNSGDKCIDTFQDYSSAKILEQWLEEKLGIQDASVPGEVVISKIS